MNLEHQLALLRQYAGHTSYIGEVGLDFSRDGKPSRSLQEQAFEALLTVPGITDKVMSVHSRGASADVVRHLAGAGAKRVIMHWFSGPVTDAELALEAGFYFSINPAMIRSGKGRIIIGRLPRERVLVESDGPYARVDGRPTHPKDVLLVREYLAKEWRASNDEVSRGLNANLQRLCEGLAALAFEG